jgi:glycosyltransferase involved in cell wall biosynthesis
MGALIGLDARMIGPVPTGLGTYAAHLSRALTTLDTENSYVIIRNPATPSPVATGPHVSEVVIDGAVDAVRNLTCGPAITRLGLDVYHSLHHFLPAALRVPRVVLTLHDLIWIEHRSLIRGGLTAPITRTVTNLYARAAMGYAVRRADRIIAISEHTRTRAVARWRLDPSRVDVVHLAVDPTKFSPSPTGTRESSPPYFLCLGNTRPYKNIPTALRAFASFGKARGSEEARLIVTGRGDGTTGLRHLARRLGIERRVTFTGSVAHGEILRLLRGATALIFPSFVEGFGFPVLEAMSAGCPVITSRAPAVVEIAGDAALACDADSPDAFAAAMQRVLSDAGLRETMRHLGIARAATFTWRECAARTLATYRALLAKG